MNTRTIAAGLLMLVASAGSSTVWAGPTRLALNADFGPTGVSAMRLDLSRSRSDGLPLWHSEPDEIVLHNVDDKFEAIGGWRGVRRMIERRAERRAARAARPPNPYFVNVPSVVDACADMDC